MQSNQELYNISPAECLKVYKGIVENSDRNWAAAALLAKRGYVGPAISLNIISVEELVKGLIILLDGNGFRLRNTKGIGRFFKEHGIRHYTAFLFLTIYLFAEDLFQLLETTFKSQDVASKVKELELKVKMLTSDEALFEQTIIRYLDKQFRKIKDEMPYFIQLERYRQIGFYCDYTDYFHSPEMLTRENYEHNQIRMKKVREMIKTGIKWLESDQEDTVKNKIKARDFFNQ